jgi:hypothetical protein
MLPYCLNSNIKQDCCQKEKFFAEKSHGQLLLFVGPGIEGGRVMAGTTCSRVGKAPQAPFCLPAAYASSTTITCTR